MDHLKHDADAFMGYIREQLSGRWPKHDIYNESRRIGSLMEALKRSHANGHIVLHTAVVSRNLLGVESIDIIDGVALEMDMQFMKVLDSLEFGGRDIWNCAKFEVAKLDPTFGLWRVWFTLYRLGFKPSHASSKLALGTRVWHDVFIGITKWTSLANVLSCGHHIYYAPVTLESETLVNSTYEVALQWMCEECKGVISSNEILAHKKVCNKPYGRSYQPQYRCLTNVGQMPFSNEYHWNADYASMPGSHAEMHHNAEPFRAFSFHGPDPDELVVSMKIVLSKHETFMQECDWDQWNNDSFNFSATLY